MAECRQEIGPVKKKLKLSINKKDKPAWHEQLECEDTPCESVQASAREEREPDTVELSSFSNEVTSEAYYSANFKAVLENVLSSSPERHVIDEDSARVVEKFANLAEPQQQLYVRLFLRKRLWMRVSKLSYKDIANDLTPVIEGLVNAGFLVNELQLADPTEVLNLLQLSELKTLCKQLRLPSSLVGSQKPKIIEALFKHDRQHQPLFGTSQFLKSVVHKAKLILGKSVRVAELPGEVFSRLMLLFSLTSMWMNGDEDNSFSQIIFRMLQVNIGRLVYPRYEINVTQPLFSTTEDFESYYLATKESQCLSQAVEENDGRAFNMVVKRAKEKFRRELHQHQTTHCKDVEHEDTSLTQHTKKVSPTPSLLPPSYLLPFSTGWVYARLLSDTVEHFDKKGKHSEANEILELLLSQDVYSTGSRGKWWDRLTLNYDYHLKLKEKCLEKIKKGLDDPFVRDARRLLLLQRARRLCQSLPGNSTKKQNKRKRSNSFKDNITSDNSPNSPLSSCPYKLADFPEMDLLPAPEVSITGKQLHSDNKSVFLAKVTTTVPSTTETETVPSTSETETETVSETERGSVVIPSLLRRNSHALVRVETYAIYHYHQEEKWPCALHAEASSFSSMFSLLMWDVIFAPGVPDVFRTPYQGGPLDLRSDHFYKNRKELIDERLQWMKEATSEELGSTVETTWQKHCNCVCVGMNWELFPTMEDAKALAMCMGGALLSHVCEIFSKDFSRSFGGLPDLTLWNPTTLKCKFVEVKGPGDRLSTKQLVWLSRLARWKCDVEVCRVKAGGS